MAAEDPQVHGYPTGRHRLGSVHDAGDEMQRAEASMNIKTPLKKAFDAQI